MSGRYLTDLAAVLTAAGLTVVEQDGWQTRARSSGGYRDGGPWCLMLHHTASAGDGAADAHYCTFVDDDRPVTNLVLGRDGVVYVCAAGATNTNGKGGPWTLADGHTVAQDEMNLRAVAVEMSNNGTGQTYPAPMIDAMFTIIAAVADAYLGGRRDLICQHVDWAPTRKIDPARSAAVEGPWQPSSINGSGSWRLADVVTEALRRSTGPTPPDPLAPPEEPAMPVYVVQAPDARWWATDMATFRTYIGEPGLAREGAALWGWQSADGAGAPWLLGAGWQPFLDQLPVTGDDDAR